MGGGVTARPPHNMEAPVSDISPYGVGQNEGPNGRQTANQLVGQPVGLVVANAVAPGVGQASLSTAPYRGRTKEERQKIEDRTLAQKVAKQHTDRMCMAPNKRLPGQLCVAPKAKGTDYCIGHLNSMKRQEASGEPAGDA